MQLLLRHVPVTLLGRIRLGAVIFGVVLVLTVPHSGALPAQVQLVSYLAAVGLSVQLVATAVRRRPLLFDAPVIGVLIVAGGVGLSDPMASTALCLAVATSQSLFGSHRAAIIRLLFVAPAVPVTVALQPLFLGRDLGWHWDLPTVLSVVPLLAMLTVVMRCLLVAIDRYEATAGRDRLLTQTLNQLLNQTNDSVVDTITATAADKIAAGQPGSVILVLSVEGDRAVVTGVAGGPASLLGESLPTDSFGPATELADSHEIVLDGPALEHLVGGKRHWRGVRHQAMDADNMWVLGSTSPIRVDLFSSVQTLGIAWSLAMANCQAHRELDHRAHYDHLTQLANRGLLQEQVHSAVDRLRAGRLRSVGLMLIDLDDFKNVNDGHGHEAGDLLLTEVSNRLIELSDGRILAARLGGDEFVLLLTDHTDDETDKLADLVRERLRRPVRVAGVSVNVGASVGVAVASEGRSGADLMRCADIAMYAAKARGKNKVEWYSETRYGEIAEVRLLEEHLTEAVDRGEIFPHYQPVIDLASGQCVGVEALARWQHPQLGAIGPDRFIPMAERSGLIVPLGDHILSVACHQAVEWSRRGVSKTPLTVAVNLAPRQLALPAFVRTVEEVLRDSGLPARRLTLEITERDLIDLAEVSPQLHALADLGVQLSIDDFGTGYTSLTMLQSLPVHQLKIDRSYLSTGDKAADPEVFELIASIGRVLGLSTVAEGVETADHIDLAMASSVALAQGFAYAPAMPANELPGWLSAHAERVAPCLRTQSALSVAVD